MSKSILIIGGGISGLAVLHYLRRKYSGRTDVKVLLLEKEASLGGTIRSVIKKGCLFETGPNGFLDSKPRTLEFAAELDLKDELIQADEQAKIRYIALNNILYPLPMDPKSFFAFPPLSWLDKLRVLAEVFIPKGRDPQESVYAFGARRLGERFSQLFLDPMVSGIYGGDASEVNLRAAFPRIYELEQKYGSLFKAMMKIKKEKKNGARAGGGMPTGTLTSFRRGQAQLIETLGRRYSENILLNHEVRTVAGAGARFTVEGAGRRYEADGLFICTPSYQAARMLQGVSPDLADSLNRVPYAPIAVIGLVFPISALPKKPRGFGYLIPSSQKREVLGVLFESNIFPSRAPEGQILLRVMLGGARHPAILEKAQEELVRLAVEEVRRTLHAQGDPGEVFFAAWPKGIPQYDRAYVAAEMEIAQELKRRPALHLVANYRGGVSLNDCIENAHAAVQRPSL